MICFCPHCAAKLTYEAVKPTRCPRCDKLFADAFRVTTPPPPTPEPVDDEPETRPLTKSALLAARQRPRAQVKPRPGQVAQDEPVFPPDDDEPDLDQRAVRRRARELAAAIDPASIIVADQDEGVFRFEQFVREAKVAQAVRPKAKRRR